MFVAVSSAAPPSLNPWPEITRESKPWARWWWLGSAVDEPNLTRELTAIAGAGFGGVEITPIYGVKGEEARYRAFLSPEYLTVLGHAAREAQRLGLGVDMATGTGWPFGGPKVTPVDAELQVAVVDGKLEVKPTRFTVKRAAPGGGGPVLNPYSAEAMTHYLAPFTTALGQLPRGALRAQFHDSFEYKATWSNKVLARLKQLHGYELTDHLAEFDGRGTPDTVARVKADYRSTIEDLHLAYVRTWVSWAHEMGELARNQAHGAPGNLLDLYAAADIPETELFGAQRYPIPGFRREAGDVAPEPQPSLVHRLASSAAHVAGRALTSSETFTWLREHFREAPSQMKPEVDELFICGINHLFYHGIAYSPADADWPGWLFYAATEANPRNPLWEQFAQVNAYNARCQSLLQAGQPDNDVLLYWPVDDLWHSDKGQLRRLSMHAAGWLTGTPAGNLANALLAGGYTFDFVSDRQLDETRCENNVLRTAGGAYRAILVPKTGHMAVSTLQRLIALANDGATVIFLDALPADVPGFGRLAERRADFKTELARIVWGGDANDGVRTAQLGHGRALLGSSLPDLMRAAAVEPEAYTALGLQFIRRRLGGDHVYFVANLSGKPVTTWVRLARPAASALLMDPLTGAFGLAAARPNGGTTEIFVQLQPGESRFVRTGANAGAGAPAWSYYQEAGTGLDLSRGWQVEFLRGGPGLPVARRLSALGSWADAADSASQSFGGTARYRCEFDAPTGAPPAAWRLDLGDVRETAVVTLNDVPFQNVWSLPFAAIITKPLAPHNVLTIDVTNTAANRIRDLDRRHVPWHSRMNFVDIDYKPFDASRWSLQPSGLLGPVRLVPLQLAATASAVAAETAARKEPTVTLQRNGNAVVLVNAQVRLSFNEGTGRLESFQQGGRELLGRGGGYVQVAFTNKHDVPPAAWRYELVRQEPSLVEIAFTCVDPQCPFDLAAHYVLRGGEMGFHQYFVYGHDAARAPGVQSLAQLNLCLRLDPKRFTTAAVDESRIKPFPAPGELTRAAMVADATYRLGGDRYYSKYFYAAEMSEAHLVHGALGADAGIWIVMPNHEHLNGGPEHQELTVHQTDTTPVLLYHAAAAHYGAGLIESDSRQGSWRKVSAPCFVYVNTGADAAALWSDAKARAQQLAAQWPYAWLDAAEFQLRRATVTGAVHTTDGLPLRAARVIVAPHQPASDWQQQWRGYRFYGWTDEKGKFAIKNVRSGEYDVFVWQAGRFGQVVERGIAVGAGASVTAGDLVWPAESARECVWQIGVPDRSAAEFGYADNFRQWALWDRIARDTHGKVSFTIGRDGERQWPFEMAVTAAATGAWQAPEWRVQFVNTGERRGKAMLFLGIAAYQGKHQPQLTLALNGEPLGEVADLQVSAAAHRSGIHAGYQERMIEFDAARLRSGENVLAIKMPYAGSRPAGPSVLPAVALLWDCLRLLAPPSMSLGTR